MNNKTQEEIINDLKAEDKRLNDIIINLHNEIRQYHRKIKQQEQIIITLNEIIENYITIYETLRDDY